MRVWPINDCLPIMLAVVLLTLAGCPAETRPPAESTTELDEMEPSFQSQLQAGRAGFVDRVVLRKTAVTKDDLTRLSDADDWLEVLLLDAGRVNDARLESIAELPNVWQLRLRQSPVSDAGVPALLEMTSLKFLNLPQSELTASGVARLADLPRLRSVRLGGPRLDADTAESIAKIESLRSVHLIGVPIDDQGLRQIASLPKLQSLYLDDSEVSTDGWDWLFETHPHLHVHVNQAHLDRDPNRHDTASPTSH